MDRSIYKLLGDNHFDEAQSLANKLLFISNSLQDKSAENEFHYLASQAFRQRAGWRSIKRSTTAYNNDKENFNFLFQVDYAMLSQGPTVKPIILRCSKKSSPIITLLLATLDGIIC